MDREEFDGLIMVAGWAITSDLCEWGTDTLEGVVFSQQYEPAFDGPRFVEFKNNFVDRFGTEPSFGAIFGYEAADLVIRAIRRGSKHQALNIKKNILSLEPFEALQGRLHLDSFGDPALPEPVLTAKSKMARTAYHYIGTLRVINDEGIVVFIDPPDPALSGT